MYGLVEASYTAPNVKDTALEFVQSLDPYWHERVMIVTMGTPAESGTGAVWASTAPCEFYKIISRIATGHRVKGSSREADNDK